MFDAVFGDATQVREVLVSGLCSSLSALSSSSSVTARFFLRGGAGIIVTGNGVVLGPDAFDFSRSFSA
jgi:hypothetical protein